MAENLPNLLKNQKEKQMKNGLLKSISGDPVRCSLPSNVNSGETTRDFLEEAKRSRDVMKDKDYTVVDMETEGLLDNDHLSRGYEERLIDGPRTSGASSSQGESSSMSSNAAQKFTSKATLHIQSNRASNISNVDDPLPLDLENDNKKSVDVNALTKVVQQSKYQVIIPAYTKTRDGEDKFFYFQKVDENGNALHQTKEKKKKKQADKNVVVVKSENIEGHKSEIINNVEQLLHYIEGTTAENPLKNRLVQASKSRQLHKQHTSEDGGKNNKKREKKLGKEASGNGRQELKKSNSLGEISGMKLDREFEAFGSVKKEDDDDDEKVILRTSKTSGERTRERRSWGNVEPPSFQALYNASSLENLETAADNWVVTRPKKKSKKRRNSVSSASGARQNSSASGVSSSISNEDRRGRRAPSPDLGVVVGVPSVNTTRSMPHSEKSNDSSSDVDSVHSLPLDGPISYADIAKNAEKKKPSPEKQERPPPAQKEKSPLTFKYSDSEPKTPPAATNPEKTINTNPPPVTQITPPAPKNVVPDVHNIKSFPAITGSMTKPTQPVISTVVSYHNNPNVPKPSAPVTATAPTYHSGTNVAKTSASATSPAVTYHSNPNPSKPTVVANSAVSHHSASNVITTSDKAVQSTLGYEETLTREKTPVSAQKNVSVGVALQTASVEAGQASGPAHSTPVVSSVGTQGGVISASAPPTANKRYTSPIRSSGKVKGSKEGSKVGGASKEPGVTQPNQIQAFFGGQGDGQNELSLMRGDPAQYAAQRMPADILDVATIEKMQFMNCSGAQNVSNPSSGTKNVTSQNQPPPIATTSAATPTQVSYSNQSTAASTGGSGQRGEMSSSSGGGYQSSKSKKRKGSSGGAASSKAGPPSSDHPPKEETTSTASVCDSSFEDRGSKMVNGLSDDTFSSPEPPIQPPESPPPVVILSGHNKEVPTGLVFGFDINEQLLLEDSGGGGDNPTNVSENSLTGNIVETPANKVEEWIKCFRPPLVNDKGPPKYNHDKIVSYISSAWDSIVSQKVQYWSDNL